MTFEGRYLHRDTDWMAESSNTFAGLALTTRTSRTDPSGKIVMDSTTLPSNCWSSACCGYLIAIFVMGCSAIGRSMAMVGVPSVCGAATGGKGDGGTVTGAGEGTGWRCWNRGRGWSMTSGCCGSGGGGVKVLMTVIGGSEISMGGGMT